MPPCVVRLRLSPAVVLTLVLHRKQKLGKQTSKAGKSANKPKRQADRAQQQRETQKHFYNMGSGISVAVNCMEVICAPADTHRKKTFRFACLPAVENKHGQKLAETTSVVRTFTLCS